MAGIEIAPPRLRVRRAVAIARGMCTTYMAEGHLTAIIAWPLHCDAQLLRPTYSAKLLSCPYEITCVCVIVGIHHSTEELL